MPSVEFQGKPSAEGQPKYVRSSQIERVDEACEAVGVLGQAERLGRIRRTAVAWRVPRHDRELIGQAIDLPAPPLAVADAAVDQDEQRPFARLLVGDAQSCDLDLVHSASQRYPGLPGARPLDEVCRVHDLRHGRQDLRDGELVHLLGHALAAIG